MTGLDIGLDQVLLTALMIILIQARIISDLMAQR